MSKIDVNTLAKEVKLTSADELISTTNKQGVITYVNQAFIEISGFSRDELLGQNHNIVRHPDMPSAAFKEMWTKLKAGQSWRGIIKNRCKNGDFYWVDSFVTPLIENGEIVGYQSVRVAAKPKLISNAERIYLKLNNNKRVADPLTLTQKRIVSAFSASIGLGIAGYIWGWGVILAGILLMSINLAIFYDEAFRIPTKLMAMKRRYDSISRFIYCGRDSSSLLDFQLMMKDAKLQGVLGRSRDHALHINDIAAQLAVSTQQTHANIDLENKQIEQIASAMEEMGASICEVANNAQATSSNIDETCHLCLDSRDKMQANSASIDTLTASVVEAAANAHQLNKEAEQVANAMSEIDAIAEQTNLLALNAAIEAARAGEQGRGFAVVADEVRALSSRTQESTNSISKSVDKMFSMLNRWAAQMDQSQSQAQQCAQDTQTSATQVDTIYQSMNKIHALAQQNAVAAEQQKQVIHEMNTNIAQIGQASFENLNAVNMVESSVAELKINAEKAKSLKKTFS